MKVSIVTISFNQAEFLEKAILSVLSQGYGDLEYIIVDPGSDDGSRDIIEKYRSEITEIIYESDDGPADGLNKGFSRATGEVFGFLNADDVLLPGAVERAISCFEKESVDLVSFNGYEIDENEKKRRKLVSNNFDIEAYVYGMCVLVQQSTFFTREAFLNVNGFNSSNRISWDGELWLDMAKKGFRFKKFPGYISGFRIYNTSITGSGDFVEQGLSVLKRHRRELGFDREIGRIKKLSLWLKVRMLDLDFWLVKIGVR